MKKPLKRTLTIMAAVAVVALFVALLVPRPIEADAVYVARGPMRVTIDEEGETRAHDRYVVASPIAGRLSRIELEVGDPVAAGAVIARVSPAPLDPRERAEAAARVDAAEALRREAAARAGRAVSDLEQARSSRERSEQLVEHGLVSRESYEIAVTAERAAARELEASRERERAAAAEVERARAALMTVDAGQRDGSRVAVVRTPTAGRVLRVLEESERIVAAGTPLVEIGDPARIEVVVDVLSSDAVRIAPGATVLVDAWGGDRPLRAVVRLVEPYAFTKRSALGVEEQRVNVVADFVEGAERLGVGYRVTARIVVWEAESVLKAPASALFRRGDEWAVFVVDAGRVRERRVEAGHRTAAEVEVLSGLSEGDPVVVHPSNDLTDGTRTEVRAPVSHD
jgi:HlyD family secretion protein